MNTTWSGDDAEIQAARQLANNLIVLFQQAGACATNPLGTAGAGDDFMLRQNPDNPCELQTSVDGVNWCTWADLSKCFQQNQPGGGTVQPGPGGCQEYSGVITPINSWVLPTSVSTGDTITVSNLNGAWSPTQFVDIWDCPDGNLFFNGICVDGTAGFDSGAPMPTAPLNGTILYDGTHYYDVSAAANAGPGVTITIGAGVSNAQLLVRCNFHGGVDPAGEVNFNIKVCKVASSRYTHTFDFTSGLHGWTINVFGGNPQGVWTPGTGFVGSNFIVSSDTVRGVNIEFLHAAFGFDTCTVNFDFVPGDQSGGVGEACQFYGLPSTTIINNLVGSSVNGTNQSITVHGSHTGITDMNLYFWSDDTSGPPSGTVVIRSITLAGSGADPF